MYDFFLIGVIISIIYSIYLNSIINFYFSFKQALNFLTGLNIILNIQKLTKVLNSIFCPGKIRNTTKLSLKYVEKKLKIQHITQNLISNQRRTTILILILKIHEWLNKSNKDPNKYIKLTIKYIENLQTNLKLP